MTECPECYSSKKEQPRCKTHGTAWKTICNTSAVPAADAFASTKRKKAACKDGISPFNRRKQQIRRLTAAEAAAYIKEQSMGL